MNNIPYFKMKCFNIEILNIYWYRYYFYIDGSAWMISSDTHDNTFYPQSYVYCNVCLSKVCGKNEKVKDFFENIISL